MSLISPPRRTRRLSFEDPNPLFPQQDHAPDPRIMQDPLTEAQSFTCLGRKEGFKGRATYG